MQHSTKSRHKPKPSQVGQPVREWSFEAIGTHWWIGLYDDTTPERLQHIEQAVMRRIELFDATYSRFRDDSLVTRMSQQAGVYTFPDDSIGLFKLYRAMYDATSHLVTPLIGSVLSEAGYDATYSFKSGNVTKPLDWDDALIVKGATVEAKVPVLLDFGAAGKGYLVDIVCELLTTFGVKHYCVDAGGDMYFSHKSAFMAVGLEHPALNNEIVGVAQLQNQALCGSAGNRRTWEGYNHIISPLSLTSPHDVQAVWTVADNVALADAVATALFFVPAESLHDHFNFEYAIVLADGSGGISPDFPGQLYTKEDSL